MKYVHSLRSPFRYFRSTRLPLFTFALTSCLALVACKQQTGISLTSFYEYDKNFPLNAEVEALGDSGDYSLYHVTYLSTHGVKVPGLLSVPKSAKGPVPAIIFVHGIGDSKTADYMEIGNRIFCQNGYAVMRIDVLNHGERKLYDHKVDLIKNYRYWSRNIIIQTVFDLRRAVDFLATRPEIDSARIGYFGISFGGFIGVVFVGVEQRVRVPVIALAGGGLNLLFGIKAFSSDVNEFLSVIEPLNFIEKISPRPLLMINTKNDEVVPPMTSRRLYAKAGEPKQIIWYDTKHRDIPPEKAFGEGVKWFDRYLK